MSLIRRTILLTLSLLVLMSSIGFSMGAHFCGGILQDMAFFHHAASCPMEQKQQAPPCHEQENGADHDDAATDMDCCDDSLVIVEGVDDALLAKSALSLKTPDLPLLAVLQTAFLFLLPQKNTQQAAPYAYTSPPLTRDITVLVQSFLI